MIPLVAPTYTRGDRQWMLHYFDVFDVDGDENEDAEVQAFEEEFAAYVGCVGGVAVNSGTNALITVFRVWNDSEFDPVGIPSYTCRATLDAVKAMGLEAEAQLLDNTCDIPNAAFGLMECAEGFRTVLTHMFGTETTGVPMSVHDITLSLGAVQSPHIAVCSFNRDKMISTGRGGMIVSQDQEFLERCRELAYYDQPRNGGYRPAFSFGMTAMQAALGRSQLRQLPTFIERRQEIAGRYTAAFTEAGIECPNPDVDSVFFRYIIGVRDPADKVAKLGEVGIEAGRGVNPPLHRLLGLDPSLFPGAEECFSKLLSVPVHPGLTDDQVSYIIEQVIQVCAP